MTEDFDVIIVGARCAGSPLAILLARTGLKVCVVDRAEFPSDTPSTHGIQPAGVKILDRIGVLDRLLELTEPVEHGVMILDDTRIELRDVTTVCGAPMVNVRRTTLDTILVDAAVAAGADVRTGTAVTGLIEDAGRVTGVVTGAGRLGARLVVGADGVRSSVARLVGAEEYHRTEAGRVFMWSYFEGAGNDGGAWLGKIGDIAYLGSPTDDGLFMAAAVPSAQRRDEVFSDREGSFNAALATWPELHAQLDGAKRVGPIRLMSRWYGYFRRSAGPGWALVGDAGHFKDPTPGQGIADALRQAVRLAETIERALVGTESPDDLLRDWWRWRDDDAWEMYWLARDLGAAGPTPLLVRAMQRRLATDPKLTADLLRVLNHDLPPSKLFSPGRSIAVALQALAEGRGERMRLLGEARTLVADEVRRQRARPARVSGS